MMRVPATLIYVVIVGAPTAALGQQPGGSEPRDEPSSIEVIDSPPVPPARATAPITSNGVILDRPGRVLLQGSPVHARFISPTNGVSFLLQSGGSYSSISGVSFGVGYGWGGPGWGWGGYGVGYGAAPYYGEVVTRAYQPICEAPCDATLLSGRHRLALSLDGGKPVNAVQAIDLRTDSIVEGRYVSKRHLRRAGLATFIAGSLAGVALMFASIDYRADSIYGDQIRYRPMFYTGVGIFLGSIIAGAVLSAQDDEAYVTATPVD